jgi:hypothetical protein
MARAKPDRSKLTLIMVLLAEGATGATMEFRRADGTLIPCSHTGTCIDPYDFLRQNPDVLSVRYAEGMIGALKRHIVVR